MNGWTTETVDFSGVGKLRKRTMGEYILETRGGLVVIALVILSVWSVLMYVLSMQVNELTERVQALEGKQKVQQWKDEK